MGRLFGTDGVRGEANRELTALLTYKLGLASARVLAQSANSSQKRPSMLIGADTRISSDMLAAALTAGICAAGVDVYNVGVIPAPAVAYLVRKHDIAAGVVVSASHNSFGDNGIKFYNGDGFKLSDEIEDKIAELVIHFESIPLTVGADVGRVLSGIDAENEYCEFLLDCVSHVDLRGLRIGLDCANGAAYRVAPDAFRRLGADVSVVSCEPDGININDNCGSTHMDNLTIFASRQGGFDVAFAFDGDGDRCFALDENGAVLDGDMLMLILAEYWKQKGILDNNTIVTTVMSNLGFFNAANRLEINALQASVGDRYVLEKMVAGGHILGGEQSGHIICLNYHTTGDGLLTALLTAQIVVAAAKKLSELNTMKKMPQALVNARVANADKQRVLDDEGICAEIAALEARFANNGRVLIRPSGTEPLIRVMIEGENLDEITTEAQRIAELMQSL